jgi:hypothetical protein
VREKKGGMKRTHVLKLDVALFTKFGHGVVSNLGWGKKPDKTHGLSLRKVSNGMQKRPLANKSKS